MKLWSLPLVLGAAALLSACTCKPHKKMDGGTDGGEIPLANADGPLKPIYFAFDSANLSSASIEVLKSNVKWLESNPNASFTIEGHCDERGTNEYNMALGSRRAQSAFDFYKSMGVSESRMSTVSYGEELPGHEEGAWAKNRRDQFRVK
jgi:peptidoglycan-associated lipoprotein